MSSIAPPKVLITNDDGPPGRDSPYVFALYTAIKAIGWDVKVVLPSSQKSWIGKAYQIKDIIDGVYYYPTAPDGHGETSPVPRPLREGEVGEWILLNGTPATCTNIALHNLYPDIDLVISGPNFGRNTSSAFSLSSGTIGAALSGSLARRRSIAVSFGTFREYQTQNYTQAAVELSIKIIKTLWASWGKDENGPRNGEVDLYSVNVPMIPELLGPEDLEVVWTTFWRNSYGSLFKLKEPSSPSAKISRAGPDAPAESRTQTPDHVNNAGKSLVFQFSPQMDGLVNPDVSTLPFGTDAHVIHNQKASVTPLRAVYAQPEPAAMRLDGEDVTGEALGGGRRFKLKS